MSVIFSKKNIFLPKKMLEELQQDADRFEAFGQGDERVMSRFIHSLLIGYYTTYSEERRQQTESIRTILQNDIHDSLDLNDKCSILLDKLTSRAYIYDEKGKMAKLPYKPIKATNWIIKDIEDSFDDTISTLSHYLRTMFASYLSLPIYEREKIIFKENVDFIEKACAKGKPIRFSPATDPGNTYHAIPYKLVHSKEEMFNYLLCQAHSTTYKDDKPFTFRLCRIQNLRDDPNPRTFTPEIKTLLLKMEETAPQYPINEDVETRVHMTPRGLQTYSRIYFGRPKYIGEDILPNGDRIYHFRSSFSQLMFYFRRFQANEAVVLEPQSLVDNIKTFHEQAWKAYEAGVPVPTPKLEPESE